MTSAEFSVSLRFQLFNKQIDITEVCKEIGMAPARKWIIGDPRKTPKGDPLPGVYDHTYCYFDLVRQADEELPDMLNRLCENMKSYRDLFRRIRSTDGKIVFYIFWVSVGNTGGTFDCDLLFKLSDLGIDLGIDVWGESAKPDEVELQEFRERRSDYLKSPDINLPNDKP